MGRSRATADSSIPHFFPLNFTSQYSTKRCGEFPTCLFHAPSNREIGEPSHRESGEPARINSIEGREIEIDVDGDAMERTSAAYAKPYRRDLAPLDVNTGYPLTSARHDDGIAEHVDHRLLERLDETAYSDLRTVQVQEQIRHELSRPVVRHLPSSIGANHRYCSGVVHMAASSGLPEREDGGMFQQPEFIGRLRNPGFRTESHRLHRRAVRHASDPASQKVPKSGRGGRVTRRVLEVHGRRYRSTKTAP